MGIYDRDYIRDRPRGGFGTFTLWSVTTWLIVINLAVFLTDNLIFSIIQPFAVIFILFIEPTGMIGIVNRVRDAMLRIVAQRRQLVVPSLFADVDPDALARRLIPLAEPKPVMRMLWPATGGVTGAAGIETRRL